MDPPSYSSCSSSIAYLPVLWAHQRVPALGYLHFLFLPDNTSPPNHCLSRSFRSQFNSYILRKEIWFVYTAVSASIPQVSLFQGAYYKMKSFCLSVCLLTFFFTPLTRTCIFSVFFTVVPRSVPGNKTFPCWRNIDVLPGIYNTQKAKWLLK